MSTKTCIDVNGNCTGICDMSIYLPRLFVGLDELEKHDDVSTGKYTIGLGQKEMSICTDREDVNSMALTVFNRLMKQSGISYDDVGRVDVGTESIIDKSKSIKTAIMQLFEKHGGNSNVEGADNLNACYGGTAALFNCVDWVESTAWDGRYGIVVMVDIAVYDDKAARPTGGAAAVAVLIGRNAPIVLESNTRSSYSAHRYDFYKPNLSTRYPMVDGRLSLECYLHAVAECYRTFRHKSEMAKGSATDLTDYDKIAFHTPFSGLVKKAFGLLHGLEETIQKGKISGDAYEYSECDIDGQYARDKAMQKHLADRFKNQFALQTEPTLRIAHRVGNSYTASVYLCIASALSSMKVKHEQDAKILVFSYGSGVISSMFELRINPVASFTNILERIKSQIDEQLSEEYRKKISPIEMEALHSQVPSILKPGESYFPTQPVETVGEGCFYLASIDERLRRHYSQRDH